jgi:hypothetical protein
VRSTRVVRFTGVATSEIETRLGSEIGRLVNVSATGALLRMNAPLPVGRSCPLFINMPASPISLTARVVRTERITPADDARAGVQQLVGVMFTEFSASARQGIAKLCGASFNLHE